MLTANTLTLRRGSRTIVDGVSLTLRAGELALVTGPNGVGKTTILRALAGLAPVASGTVTRTAGCCFVGSVPLVKDMLTVREHQALWRRLYGGAGGVDVSGCQQTFDLPTAGTLGKTLSSGQKQRLHLSRLWQSGAPLWLLDEPLNALDGDAVAAFTTALAAHLAGGGAAVVASHQELALVPACRLHLSAAGVSPRGDASEDDLAKW